MRRCGLISFSVFGAAWLVLGIPSVGCGQPSFHSLNIQELEDEPSARTGHQIVWANSEGAATPNQLRVGSAVLRSNVKPGLIEALRQTEDVTLVGPIIRFDATAATDEFITDAEALIRFGYTNAVVDGEGTIPDDPTFDAFIKMGAPLSDPANTSTRGMTIDGANEVGIENDLFVKGAIVVKDRIRFLHANSTDGGLTFRTIADSGNTSIFIENNSFPDGVGMDINFTPGEIDIWASLAVGNSLFVSGDATVGAGLTLSDNSDLTLSNTSELNLGDVTLSRAAAGDARVDGRIGLNVNPNRMIHVRRPDDNSPIIVLERTGTSPSALLLSASANEASLFARTSDTNTDPVPMAFHTGATERMRITSGGDIVVAGGAVVGHTRENEAKTSNYTLVAGDSGKTLTNVGASGTITFTIAASLPVGFTVRLVREANQEVRISSIADDVYNGNTQLVLGVGVEATMSSARAMVDLEKISADTWQAVTVGTVAADP